MHQKQKSRAHNVLSYQERNVAFSCLCKKMYVQIICFLLIAKKLFPACTFADRYLNLNLKARNFEKGLYRLLELLSDWFNLTLGEKLIDHLTRWLDPDQMGGQVGWRQGGGKINRHWND